MAVFLLEYAMLTAANSRNRSVAQFGRALRSGRRGRGFESRRFDSLAGAPEAVKGFRFFFPGHCKTTYRSVAQFGRALRSGRRGRGFESRRFDFGFGGTLRRSSAFCVQKRECDFITYRSQKLGIIESSVEVTASASDSGAAKRSVQRTQKKEKRRDLHGSNYNHKRKFRTGSIEF